MATEFIIVVDVDHQRAQAAYRKGIDDLNMIWPQLMVYAEAVDGPRNERVRKEREEHEKEINAYFQRINDHTERVKQWECGGMLRGPRPSMDVGLTYRPLRVSYSYEHLDMLRSCYDSIRNELKRKSDIAGAAISPYRMTESQVREMVAWEDGSRIERLKKEISNERGEA